MSQLREVDHRHPTACELHSQGTGKNAKVTILRIREICWGILVVASASPLGAGEPMTIKVSPAVAMAPATLKVRASIESNAENRAIEVVVDSPDFYRSSLIELEGEYAPRTTVFEVQNLPGGRYVVTTRLLGSSGQTRSAVRQTINVISP
jgi:hypothetical protein